MGEETVRDVWVQGFGCEIYHTTRYRGLVVKFTIIKNGVFGFCFSLVFNPMNRVLA